MVAEVWARREDHDIMYAGKIEGLQLPVAALIQEMIENCNDFIFSETTGQRLS